MNKMTKGVYEAPNVAMCNIPLERGFAISGPTDFMDPDYDGRPEE